MLNALDRLINNTVMYRLTLYCLIGISVGAIIFSFLGLIAYSEIALIGSLVVIVAVAYVVNAMLASIWKAPTNPESSLITALILFLIMPPAANVASLLDLVIVTLVAIASKYIIAYNFRHVFNPAALGAFIAPFVTGIAATWWVGSAALLPLVAIAGILIVRKIRRHELVIAFVLASIVGMTFRTFTGEGSEFILPALLELFVSWPLVFLGAVMLTEPITTPPTKGLQMLYGVIVGLLFTVPFSIGPVYGTPEVALLVGNLYAYAVSMKRRLILSVESVEQVSPDTYHFRFSSPSSIMYTPGQYLEWTLPHTGADKRGIRRYFTIASAPSEPLSIGIKIREGASSFKKALKKLQPGDTITAGGLYGDFLLHPNSQQPLVWIAGGIGITPFRSMAKHLLAQDETRDVVLFYCCSLVSDFDYMDIFEEAKRVGIRVVPVVTGKENIPDTWSGERGFLTEEVIKKHVPEYTKRHFYLSGPNAMVVSYKKLLHTMGVSSSSIHTDYFPGF